MFTKSASVCKNAKGGAAIFMKKFFVSIGFLVLSFALLSGYFAVPASAQTADREWLILVYVSALNDRGLNGGAKELINQLEKVGSNDKVTVVVKYGILETNANNVSVKINRAVKALKTKFQN